MMIESSLTLRCLTQDQGDFNRGIVRLDPGDMKRLGLSAGARVAVRAGRAIYAVMQPATKEHRNQGLVLLDDLQLHNCGVKNGDMVKVLPAPEIAASEQLTLAAQHALDARAAQARLGIIRAQLEGQVVSTGDVLRVRMADQYDLMLQVTDTGGNAPALVRGHTVLQVTAPAHAATPPAMAQLGGLRREFHWLEEWLQSAHAAPQRGRGLVLESAAGCGKHALVEALAHYTGAALHRLPVARLAAEPEKAAALIAEQFAAAAGTAPSILMIDDMDLLAPALQDETARRLANQFYAQLDALPEQAAVAVIGLAYQRTALDPAALRSGRFERTLSIDLPDMENRLEILGVLTQALPLAADVKLERLAGLTQGFAGSDLQLMVQQARLRAQRMARLRARATGAAAAEQPIAMHHFRAALTEVAPAGRGGYMTETSTIGWQDIAGYEDIKQTLREAVERPINYGFLNDNKGAPPPHGVLVTGAAGTGKTSLVRALAGATRAQFIHVNAYDIVLAEAPAAALRHVFTKARQSAPCMLFFDNLEAVIPALGQPHDDKIALAFNAFLREFDMTHDLLGLTVLAATSHVDRIDQLLLRPGRFDYVINIPLPDLPARQKIFTYHEHWLPLAADVNCDELAAMTQGFTGGDIEGICRRAGLMALRQSVAMQDGQLTPPVVNMSIFAQILRGWRQ